MPKPPLTNALRGINKNDNITLWTIIRVAANFFDRADDTNTKYRSKGQPFKHRKPCEEVKREEQEEQPTQTNMKTHMGETQEGKKLRNIQKLNAMRGSARLMLSKQCQLIEKNIEKKVIHFKGEEGKTQSNIAAFVMG